MAFTYLQAFLDARLFTIAEENSNYQFLTATIPLFQKAIAKNKSKLITATLVAIDQHIPPDDPILDEVEELLKKKWPLVRNKYSDRPTTLLRAIIVESLYGLMQENKGIANLIWLTGSNLFPLITASLETPILQQWLKEAGETAESNAVAEWGLTSQISAINIPTFTIEKIALSNVTFDKAGLKSGLKDATMNGNQITGQNYNSGPVLEAWCEDFSTKASESFFNVFSKAVGTLNTSLNAMDFDKPINDFFNAFKEDLTKTLTTSLKSSEKLKLRSQILWWKEALYSASCQKSYRDMTAAQVSLTMAVDLASDTPANYPVSIDYILKETVLSCLQTDAPGKPLSDLLTELKEVPNPVSTGWDIPDQGRISIGAFIAGLSTHKTTASELSGRTGIAPNTKINYRELATLLFHDIQARQITLKL